ncbi:hypothetical protein Nepgr_002716 [Nepenthes gracilis]|uniref:Secreted protein n=1 Tax=Nepenthes gracilis TaxID=150966 RepID=A0AAD3PA93_NEPGR|nr:hypothetical protein Nepgr_002716 [Nepenthes gracilis]
MWPVKSAELLFCGLLDAVMQNVVFLGAEVVMPKEPVLGLLGAMVIPEHPRSWPEQSNPHSPLWLISVEVGGYQRLVGSNCMCPQSVRLCFVKFFFVDCCCSA